MCAVSTSVMYVNPSFDPNDSHLDSSSENFAEIDLLVMDTTTYSAHVPLKECTPNTTSASKNTARIKSLVLIVGTVLLGAFMCTVLFTFIHNNSS